MNIYVGQEPNCDDVVLVEGVVKTLSSTVQGKDVTLAFSRFLTSSLDGHPEF
jgi:hypothetical protein